MNKILLATVAIAAITTPSLAQDDQNPFVFRAKVGVISVAESVAPPIEPSDPDDDDDQGADDGVFIIQHGATMWPITDVLRPGDRVSYSVALDNSSDVTVPWAQWRSIRAQLSPVQGGNFLEAIGITEQAVCQEFSGMDLGPWHAAPCDAIQSRPITQEEICAHPSPRISGTFRIGSIRLEGVEWRPQDNSQSYDLALDKSGCETEQTGQFQVNFGVQMLNVVRGQLSAGDFLYLNAVLESAGSGAATRADFGTVTGRRVANPNGSIVDQIGIDAMPLCNEYSGSSQVGPVGRAALACNDIFSAGEITQEMLCSVPGDRISGTLSGSLEITGSPIRSDITITEYPEVYDLTIDKSGCEQG